MTRKQAAQIVATLAAAFPQSRVTEETSEVYEQLLGDLDFETTQRACSRLIGTSEWMPTIAKIRSAVADLTLGPPRTGGEAWADAIAAVRTIGRYGSPEWEDPILAEAMRLWGSWRDFCNSPEDDPGGRARFIELYEQLAARKRTDVVSGIALPAPKQAPILESHEQKGPATGARRRPVGVMGAPDGLRGSGDGGGFGPAAALVHQIVSTHTTGAASRNAPGQANRAAVVKQTDREPRRMTAAEIDAALEAR